MSLHDLITVRSAYTRSINVEKHKSSIEREGANKSLM